jgi:signal recognition particle receptor subunit beta
MFINHSSKEVTAKIVYYGPGLSGKTTCLQYIFSVTNPNSRGELISIETEIERTLFFDLLPINVGLVKGYQTKFQLYTVPGQVFYDSTRKLVLKGADGVVFIADSQMMMENQNLDSLENLKKNLTAHKLDANDIPMVFQYNKRDLGNIIPIEKLNNTLNPKAHPYFGTIATKGDGVIEALREISNLILRKIKILLDQADELDPKTPLVEFDTNKKHKIIDKKELPFKKIQADSLENIDQESLPKEIAMKPVEKTKDRQDEEILTIETVEEIDDLKDILIGEEPMPPEPIADLEEIKIDEETKDAGIAKKFADIEIPEIDELENHQDPPPKKHSQETDVDTAEFKEMEELIERTKAMENEPELDNEPFKDLEDIQINVDDEQDITKIEFGVDMEEEIQDLDEINELVKKEEKKAEKPAQTKVEEAEETREAEPFKLQEEPQTIKKPEPVKELEEVKDYNKKPLEKKKKQTPTKPKELDLFDQFKDKTRLTIIKTIPVKEKGTDSQLLIDIKDKDSNLLESVKVKITQEIKKNYINS